MKAKCDGCEAALDIQLPEPDRGIRLVCGECAKKQNEKLFVNERVITRGVADELSDEEMMWVWHELRARQRLYGKYLSYLQVFYVRQKKVWVLDDGSVTTMLLPEEY